VKQYVRGLQGSDGNAGKRGLSICVRPVWLRFTNITPVLCKKLRMTTRPDAGDPSARGTRKLSATCKHTFG
jgi:hypothetical protein